jgi:ParD-like antitoxin of type II bacterial toxin-antitoxin system
MESIRVADRTYELAQQEAAVMGRSIAQHVEHWAQIGAAFEAAGVTLDQLRAILGGDLRADDAGSFCAGCAISSCPTRDARPPPRNRDQGSSG